MKMEGFYDIEINLQRYPIVVNRPWKCRDRQSQEFAKAVRHSAEEGQSRSLSHEAALITQFNLLAFSPASGSHV